MHNPHISQDDLLDVTEMTTKLECYISNLLNTTDLTLAMSSLMSAAINCMLGQCRTLDEAIFYRNVFMQLFDRTIRSIKIKEG